MNDKIEQEIIINAPVATVWEVITKPEHISKWFSDKVEIDLRKGGKGKLSWENWGEAPLEVVELNEPNRFAFTWISADEETRSTNQQTLVEFKLTEESNGTKLLLIESIFDKLKLSDTQKEALFKKHTGGWKTFAERIKNYAESR